MTNQPIHPDYLAYVAAADQEDDDTLFLRLWYNEERSEVEGVWSDDATFFLTSEKAQCCIEEYSRPELERDLGLENLRVLPVTFGTPICQEDALIEKLTRKVGKYEEKLEELQAEIDFLNAQKRKRKEQNG